ncbi:DMT family transporter [Escherichia coli]|uniref:DMT family transporter n=1 Tax=Escherichia coli TaxID=562 RepID=UPI0028830585|nr:DMT family transporter [Escherichia coli]
MKKNKYSTPLWMLATILAGMLSPMQSAVNGQLGHWLQDVLIPSLGNTVYLVTIIGTLFALVGAIVTTIPEYRASKTMKKMEV